MCYIWFLGVVRGPAFQSCPPPPPSVACQLSRCAPTPVPSRFRFSALLSAAPAPVVFAFFVAAAPALVLLLSAPLLDPVSLVNGVLVLWVHPPERERLLQVLVNIVLLVVSPLEGSLEDMSQHRHSTHVRKILLLLGPILWVLVDIVALAVSSHEGALEVASQHLPSTLMLVILIFLHEPLFYVLVDIAIVVVVGQIEGAPEAGTKRERWYVPVSPPLSVVMFSRWRTPSSGCEPIQRNPLPNPLPTYLNYRNLQGKQFPP